MTSRKVQKRISELVNPSKASNEEFAEKKKRERQIAIEDKGILFEDLSPFSKVGHTGQGRIEREGERSGSNLIETSMNRFGSEGSNQRTMTLMWKLDLLLAEKDMQGDTWLLSKNQEAASRKHYSVARLVIQPELARSFFAMERRESTQTEESLVFNFTNEQTPVRSVPDQT